MFDLHTVCVCCGNVSALLWLLCNNIIHIECIATSTRNKSHVNLHLLYGLTYKPACRDTITSGFLTSIHDLRQQQTGRERRMYRTYRPITIPQPQDRFDLSGLMRSLSYLNYFSKTSVRFHKEQMESYVCLRYFSKVKHDLYHYSFRRALINISN